MEESRYEKYYLLELSEQEREYLHKLISSGAAPARKSNRARILLKDDIVEQITNLKQQEGKDIAIHGSG